VLAEGAEHGRGDHADSALVHAAGGHALVAADHDHADAARLQHALDAAGDLRGHLLLHLEATGVGVHDPRQLADAHDLAVGQVADMRLADDRRHVVLAVRLELDVAQHDQLVVAGDLLEGAREVVVRVQLVAAVPVLVGPGDARRGLDQAFAPGILPGPAQQGADGLFRLLAGHAGGAGGLAHVVRLVRGGAGILPQGPPAAPGFHVQTTRCARLSLRARPRPSNARRVPPPGAPAASRAAIHTG